VIKTRNKQIYEEAAEWLVELRVGDKDAAARQRLDAWFRESPQHIRAFLELSSIWEEGGDPDLDRDNSAEVLIARARASTNVIALEGEGAGARGQGSDHVHPHYSNKPVSRSLALARFFSWPSVALASVVLACLVGGLVALNVYWNSVYSTGMGEQRTVHLADGSTVELNSKSRIRVLLSEHERDVDLIEGQALFHVAKDHTRPFIVSVDGMRVRAVGTQFDVYRKSSGTVVTVVEGRVAVYAQKLSSPALPFDEGEGNPKSLMTNANSSPPIPRQQLEGEGPTARAGGEAASWPAVFVSTGEQVTMSDQAAPEPRRADVRAATGWTKRELVFDMTPLSEVALEFNRYNAEKLIVSDPTLEGFHVTGIFSSTDSASLLRFLRAQRGVEVVEAGKEIRISKK